MKASLAHARKQSSRRAVILPSLFWSRARPDFYAVTCRLGADGIRFRSAIIPNPGEHLTCSIGLVGTLEVRVAHTAERAFTVKPAPGRQHNTAIARTLVELAGRQSRRLDRHGTSPRIVPRRTEVAVALADGTVLKGRLAEVSIARADVYLAAPVAVGAKVRLGATEAVVAHSFRNGIGAYFLSPLDPDLLDEGLVL
ncbi:PilZ domain-containing protein [Methylobacterium sp. WL122]|nr:PilZ domain-containing protein [Methylobacterium sp. WL122]